MFGFLCSGVDASRWGLGTMFLRSLPFLLFAHDSLASILAREDELPGTAHKMFAGIPPPSCMRWPPTRRANEMITDLRSFRWRPPWACGEDSCGGVKNNVRQVVVSGIQRTAVTGPGSRGDGYCLNPRSLEERSDAAGLRRADRGGRHAVRAAREGSISPRGRRSGDRRWADNSKVQL
jgi:hypothetical protein